METSRVAPTSDDSQFTFADAVSAAQDGAADINSITATLISKLTEEERLFLLDGDEEFWEGLTILLGEGYNRRPYVHGEVKRLGIPGVRFADGPRGCVLGQSTAFPVPMARGASWDVDLEERIGTAIGRECRAQGANFFGGVCVNLPRHPAWGRIQETYSDDPVLLGAFGSALTRGIQRSVMACVKHYALNSMENARFQVDVKIDEGTLREVFLAHFREIIEAGAASVMSSYNSVRGEFAGQNQELLTDILRKEWGFDGFVISDFLFGLRDAPLSLRSGLDIEAPFRNLRARYLKKALEAGEVSQDDVYRACSNILRRQIMGAVKREVTEPPASIVFCKEHRLLAREAAVKTMTLIKNQPVHDKPLLPLEGHLKKVAVLGRLANSNNTGDRGSSAVRSPEVISGFQGIREALTNSTVVLDDSDDAKKAAEVAADADVAVVIVGYDWQDEGEFTIPPFQTNPDLLEVLPPSDGLKATEETRNSILNDADESGSRGSSDPNYGIGAGGDRISLRLRKQDVEVIKAAVAANPRTVVCVIASGAVIMEEWDSLPPAILFSWYSGSEGGRGLADILLGRDTVCGKLPFAIPKTEEHLPFFDRDARDITYDQWFGQRLLDKLGVEAAYPLGYGLSYTSFKISGLQVGKAADPEKLHVSVQVSNTGERKGRFIAQAYGSLNVPDRPKRVLLGFGVAELAKGETRALEFAASTRPLQKWNKGTWELVATEVDVEVGTYSGDPDSLKESVKLA
jgi:beta-glucosidase